MASTPSLQFSVMCLDLVEEEKKPPTLQYLFYELPFPQLPYTMGSFHVINCWSNGTGEYKQAIKILNPSRSKTFIETGEQKFVLEDPYTPQLMINKFADLNFLEAGHYWVQNFLNGNLLLEYPLTVRTVDSGQPPGPATDKPAEKAPLKIPGILLTPDEWNIPK